MGGMMNVPPEKTRKFKVRWVCLEHGKKDPKPRVPYKIVPLDSFTDDSEVIELCTMLGRGELNQRAAQAAAWHLANDMSWLQLARKQIEHINAPNEPYFRPQELYGALRIVGEAARRVRNSPDSAPVASQTLYQPEFGPRF